jgi:hypothetical protein
MQNSSWKLSRACARGTCVPLNDSIIHWVVGMTSTDRGRTERVCLLLGQPQCGKSSVAHTIAQRFEEGGRLGSSIFLCRNVEGRNDPQAIFTTMARELAAFDEKLEENISRAIERIPNLPSAEIERQFRDLILGPTKGLTMVGPILVIIDGLDECNDRSTLLHILARETVHLPTNFRVLITARPEPDILTAFRDLDHCHVREMGCDDGADTMDIQKYIEETLTGLAEERPAVFEKCSHTMAQEQFVERAKGIHLWVSTACKFITVSSVHEASQFLDIITSQSPPRTADEAMHHLYLAILQVVFSELPIDSGGRRHPMSLAFLKSFLPVIVKNNTPISRNGPIYMLHQIGCILETQNGPSSMPHPCFEHFIHRKNWFVNNLQVDTTHQASSCLDVMNRGLSYNICHIKDTSTLNSDIPDRDTLIEQFVPEVIQFAACNWATLLNAETDVVGVLEKLRRFLFQHLLHWVELLSLLGQFETILKSLYLLDEWLEVCSAMWFIYKGR